MSEKTVRFAGGVWQQGFTIVPNAVLLSDKLSANAKTLYALLTHYARQSEKCWPGQERLGEQAQLSESSVRRALRELEVAELLETRRRGQGKTNLYVLLEPRPVNMTGLDRSQGPIEEDVDEAGGSIPQTPSARSRKKRHSSRAAGTNPRARRRADHDRKLIGD